MDNKLILSAHQPVYLPWLGLFHKIALSDIYCVFDIVQYQRKDFNNRNKIKTSNGPIWLSVPVESSNRLSNKISDTKIIHNGWHQKHIKSIELNYKRTVFFELYFEKLKDILNKKHQFLTDLNFDLLIFFIDALKIKTQIIKASDYSFVGEKSDLVLDMCLKLNSDIYIFGEQGKNYADKNSFISNQIFPYFQNYKHPTYDQIRGKFEPYMSIIDLLFNIGPQSSEVLMSGNDSKSDLLEIMK
jgi:hypothetical protein